jgi:uncharacterized membrane protein
MIPKSRIDALTDGVFAFATTLLVLDLRLPEAFNPASSAELIGAIKELQGQFTAYIISFAVLGLRWLAQSTSRGVPETVSRKYGFWMLVYLFFITCIPFSTMVIGRYNDFAPASWLYAANMMLSALATLRLSSLPEETTNRPLDNQARLGGAVLFVSAVLSVALSFYIPRYATVAYALNVIPSFMRHRKQSPRGPADSKPSSGIFEIESKQSQPRRTGRATRKSWPIASSIARKIRLPAIPATLP